MALVEGESEPIDPTYNENRLAHGELASTCTSQALRAAVSTKLLGPKAPPCDALRGEEQPKNDIIYYTVLTKVTLQYYE